MEIKQCVNYDDRATWRVYMNPNQTYHLKALAETPAITIPTFATINQIGPVSPIADHTSAVSGPEMVWIKLGW